MSKDDWAKAERAAEHWLVSLGCVATRRAVRTQWQSVDFFGCDVMGKRPRGNTMWVQVTAGGSADVAHRRRKIEQFPWSPDDTVVLLEMRSEKVGRSIAYRFRVHEFRGLEWKVWGDDVVIPREWFKALKGRVT